MIIEQLEKIRKWSQSEILYCCECGGLVGVQHSYGAGSEEVVCIQCIAKSIEAK